MGHITEFSAFLFKKRLCACDKGFVNCFACAVCALFVCSGACVVFYGFMSFLCVSCAAYIFCLYFGTCHYAFVWVLSLFFVACSLLFSWFGTPLSESRLAWSPCFIAPIRSGSFHPTCSSGRPTIFLSKSIYQSINLSIYQSINLSCS